MVAQIFKHTIPQYVVKDLWTVILLSTAHVTNIKQSWDTECAPVGMGTWVETPTEDLAEALSEARSGPTGRMQE